MVELGNLFVPSLFEIAVIGDLSSDRIFFYVLLSQQHFLTFALAIAMHMQNHFGSYKDRQQCNPNNRYRFYCCQLNTKYQMLDKCLDIGFRYSQV